jgi:hypothetical protein
MKIKVKRKSQITHFSSGSSKALEFPLKQQEFELTMQEYQALMEYFNAICDTCKKEFDSYPDFAAHKHGSEKN